MDISKLISIGILGLVFLTEIFIIFFSNIELKKRRILLVLDFISLFLIICLSMELLLFLIMPFMMIPYALIFSVIYNLILLTS